MARRRGGRLRHPDIYTRDGAVLSSGTVAARPHGDHVPALIDQSGHRRCRGWKGLESCRRNALRSCRALHLQNVFLSWRSAPDLPRLRAPRRWKAPRPQSYALALARLKRSCELSLPARHCRTSVRKVLPEVSRGVMLESGLACTSDLAASPEDGGGRSATGMWPFKKKTLRKISAPAYPDDQGRHRNLRRKHVE